MRNLLTIFRKREMDEVDRELHSLRMKPSNPYYQDARKTLEEYGEVAKILLAGLTQEDRKYANCVSPILSALDEYGAERVKEVLISGHKASYWNLPSVCKVFDKLKTALEQEGESARYKIKFHGHVQGVGFRDSFRHYAAVCGLKCDYAENLPDGTVETMVTATEPFLKLLLDFLTEEFHIEKIDVNQ